MLYLWDWGREQWVDFICILVNGWNISVTRRMLLKNREEINRAENMLILFSDDPELVEHYLHYKKVMQRLYWLDIGLIVFGVLGIFIILWF